MRSCADDEISSQPTETTRRPREAAVSSKLPNEDRIRIAMRYHLWFHGSTEITSLDDVRRHPTNRFKFLGCKWTCKRIFDKLQASGSIFDRERSGRPTVKTPAKMDELVVAIRRDRRAGGQKLGRRLSVGKTAALEMRRALKTRGATTRVSRIALPALTRNAKVAGGAARNALLRVRRLYNHARPWPRSPRSPPGPSTPAKSST